MGMRKHDQQFPRFSKSLFSLFSSTPYATICRSTNVSRKFRGVKTNLEREASGQSIQNSAALSTGEFLRKGVHRCLARTLRQLTRPSRKNQMGQRKSLRPHALKPAVAAVTVSSRRGHHRRSEHPTWATQSVHLLIHSGALEPIPSRTPSAPAGQTSSTRT